MSPRMFLHNVKGVGIDCPACRAAEARELRSASEGAPVQVIQVQRPSLALLAWKLRATRDGEAGATYVYLTDTDVHRTIALSDSVNVDLDAAGNPVGVEVLH